MKKLGLYFHIPFCNSKCHYCDFDSNIVSNDNKKIYVEKLVEEIYLANEIYNLRNYEIDSIFIGGGTPTSLDEDMLYMLLQKIEDSFYFSDDLEYSIEMNPNSISEEKIKIISNSKINRVSIGLQSTNSKELVALGRTHSYTDFEKTYDLLRKNSINNINIDVMIGIPYQNMSSYSENLKNIVGLAPQHISAYMLIIEEGTLFGRMYYEGKISVDDDLTLRLYDYTIDYLSEHGYEQYEISNFAKKGKMCKHNVKYWSLDEYLGFGQSAHSYFNGKRFANSSEDYIKILSQKQLPIVDEQIQSEKDLYEEWIFLKLRMNKGIVIDDIDTRFSMDFREKYKDKLDSLYKRGLINKYDYTLSLTREGIKVSNSIFLDFF